MIEYKNDEALNFETVQQENLTKDSIIKELKKRIQRHEESFNNFDIDSKTILIMRGELLAYITILEQIRNNCFLK